MVKHPKGQRKFGREEFLTLQQRFQIFSFYSRKEDFIREHTISKLEQNLLKWSWTGPPISGKSLEKRRTRDSQQMDKILLRTAQS